MTRGNRLDEARHNSPRTHDAREFDNRADDVRAAWVEPEWDIENYNPAAITGKVRLPAGLEEDGMAWHGGRFMTRGEFDTRSEELIAVKQYRRPNPAKLKNRPMANPHDIDAPFQVKYKDIEFLYRPEAMRVKDDIWRANAAKYQYQNAEGVVRNMTPGEMARDYGAGEY